MPVRDSLLIRLVDGEPSAEPFGSEVDYLAAPLSVGVGDAEAWRVEVVTEDDFLAPRLDPADVLVLANVAAPTVEQARKLPGLVRAGMGLAIFSGAKLDAGLYNERLLRGGDPLLPSALKSQVDESIRGVLVEPVRPSPIEKLMELKASALERVAVRQFMAVEEPAEGRGEVRVLARWNDPGRSPAILERTVGEGRVLLWTTSADRAGNDWPIEPSFVLAVREAIRGSARPTPDRPHRHRRRSPPAGRPVRPAGRQRPGHAAGRLRPEGPGGRPARPQVDRRPGPGRVDRPRRDPPPRPLPARLGRGAARGPRRTSTPPTPTPARSPWSGSPSPPSSPSSPPSPSTSSPPEATGPRRPRRPAWRSGAPWPGACSPS